MSRRDTKVADRLEPARERLSHAGELAREGAEIARERAREGVEVARERATEVTETLEPTVRRSTAAVSGAARSALAFLTVVPSLLAKLLAVLATLSGGLAERGREVAARVEPPRSERRRSAVRTAAWFAGGFTAGTAAGWVLHARMQERPYESDHGYGGTTEGSPYGEEAEAIDARRENAPIA